MNYYFPTFLELPAKKDIPVTELEFGVNSGKNAIRLLIRSYGLPAKSPVAIPAYACSAVSEAVLEEGMQPVFFDLKEKNYWTDYNFDKILSESCSLVILVHLYGFLHPDTKEITAFCRKHNILVLHDAAQSFGIDESLLEGNGIVYSFGPGKSVTAAGGGWIRSIDKTFFKANTHSPSLLSRQRSKFFLKSRILNYRYSFRDRIMQRVVNSFSQNERIEEMNSLAKKVNSWAMTQLDHIREKRKSNYWLLASSIEHHPTLRIAFDDGKGQYFKFVIFAGSPDKYKDYLTEKKVPWFSLFKKEEIRSSPLLNFATYGASFIELSCEACLPEKEISRVAAILTESSQLIA